MTLISAKAWEAAAQVGDSAVREALAENVITTVRGTGSIQAGLAVALGGLVAVGGLLRTLNRGGDSRLMEAMALAHLRGELRGADGPIDETGAPYEGTQA